MLPRCILAIVLHRGDLQEEKWGWGTQIGYRVGPLDLCVCNGAIYEETVAPFLPSGGSHLFATEAAVQILAVLVHLLQLQDSLPLPLPPSLLPPSITIHFICQTHKGRHKHNRGAF